MRMAVVEESYKKVLAKYDYVTVEGSGGILSPIDFDGEGIWLEDIVKRLELSSVIIADAGLGTINSVVLTCEYMKSKGLPVKGIIFNNWTGGVMQEDNVRMCEYMTGIKEIARIAEGAGELPLNAQTLMKLYE